MGVEEKTGGVQRRRMERKEMEEKNGVKKR